MRVCPISTIHSYGAYGAHTIVKPIVMVDLDLTHMSDACVINIFLASLTRGVFKNCMLS